MSRDSPRGFIWDSVNYSCAYDATFTVLLNIWLDDPILRGVEFSAIGEAMVLLSSQFRLASIGHQVLERSRNTVRAYLHNLKPDCFPYGPNGTSVDRLCELMFPPKVYGVGQQTCNTC
ncbi:hypothetical protein C8R47DRAFT_995628, partial [Mycena vitilis]